MKAAVIVQRLGPYHAARLRALAGATGWPLAAVEVVGRDETYAWAPVETPPGVERITLFDREGEATAAVWRGVQDALDAFAPDVVAAPGWSDPAALAAFAWRPRAARSILMSDSTAWDAKRVAWRERVKRYVVGFAGSALVAGEPHRDYLADLGMPRRWTQLGYDVVDNRHFAEGADRARAEACDLRRRHDLPERYLLCLARFVEKKNLARLLEAFAAYRRGAPPEQDALKLLLVGDGPLRPDLEARIAELGLGGVALVRPFAQYDFLPTLYGLACGFILPSVVEQWGLVVNEAMAAALPVLVSSRCGCARDLVLGRDVGAVFDPFDTEAIATAIAELAASPSDRLAVMGASARRQIADWSPERFSQAFVSAAESQRPLPPRPAGETMLRALATAI